MDNPASSFPETALARRRDAIRRVLIVVLFLNLAVAAAKLTYGAITRSASMMADGLHSLMDSSSNIIGLVAVHLAARPPDSDHPYGHERYESLASMGVAVLMGVALMEIVREAWARLGTGVGPEVTGVSFAIMVGTMAVNAGVSYWERRRGRQLSSDFLLADAMHTASDILVSFSVIGSLVAVRIGFPIADAIVAVSIAGVIAWAAWGIVRRASQVLCDAAVGDPWAMVLVARQVEGVVDCHKVRARGTAGMVRVDMHVLVDPGTPLDRAHELATRVEEAVRRQVPGVTEVIVHLEPSEPFHVN